MMCEQASWLGLRSAADIAYCSIGLASLRVCKVYPVVCAVVSVTMMVCVRDLCYFIWRLDRFPNL